VLLATLAVAPSPILLLLLLLMLLMLLLQQQLLLLLPLPLYKMAAVLLCPAAQLVVVTGVCGCTSVP
jgi:hypothetical protein